MLQFKEGRMKFRAGSWEALQNSERWICDIAGRSWLLYWWSHDRRKIQWNTNSYCGKW